MDKIKTDSSDQNGYNLTTTSENDTMVESWKSMMSSHTKLSTSETGIVYDDEIDESHFQESDYNTFDWTTKNKEEILGQ